MNKKLLAAALAVLLLLTAAGCKKAGKTLDLEKAAANIEATGQYNNMLTPDDEYLKTVLGLDPALVQKSLISIPLMNVKSSLYFVVLPVKGSESAVKTALDDYMTQYDKMWSQYLPDQAELVNNRMVTELETSEGTYYVYIISEDNDAVYKALTDSLA